MGFVPSETGLGHYDTRPKFPKWYAAYNLLGYIEGVSGNNNEAKRLFENVVDMDQGRHVGWYNLACTESLLGNLQRSIDLLTKIIETPVIAESLRQILIRTGKNFILGDADFDNLRKSKKFKKEFADLTERFDSLIHAPPPALLPREIEMVSAVSAATELPLVLKRFHIQEFQCIKNAHLYDLPVDAPWIFITGDNGDGKTSLLQALVIGLNGSKDAAELLENNRYCHIGVDVLENGRPEVRDFSWRQEHWKLADDLGDTTESLAHLVAYGPARLDMTGEKNQPAERAENSRVYSLLQQRGNLRNIEHWLKDRILESETNKHNRRRIDAVKKILIQLMPNVTAMERVGSVFKYTEKGFEVTAGQLSSGQYNVLAMVGDLLIRLYESQPEVVEPVDLQGIVFIDELDVHFHPGRQKELPGQLSAIFPKVQFVASTHSVIPIMGAPKGSVFLLVTRDPDPLKGTRIEIGNLLPNSILTSPLFNMKSLLAKQNKSFAEVYTDDDYAEIKREKEVDEALKQIADSGAELPGDFFEPEA